MTSAAAIKREDVPQEQTWNRESLFDSWDAVQKEIETAAGELPGLEAFAGSLNQGPSRLADYLEALMKTLRRIDKLGTYLAMATNVDTGDSVAKATMGQFMGLYGKFGAAVAFGEPEMLDLDKTLFEWAEQEPRLKIYKHYFDDLLRRKTHMRSPEVEKILGMLTDPFSGPYQTYTELADTDLKFPDAVDSDGKTHRVAQEIVPPTGIKSRDRERRRTAWESFYDGHLGMENTLASNYITSVKQQVFMARARGYSSVLELRLEPLNLPLEMFDNLVNTFKDNLGVWHRYWEAKRKALGVEQLRPYDIWAPLVADEPEISYQQAIEWICAGVAPLGDDYVATLRRGCLEERWVDYAQNEGRGQGAFCTGSYDSTPFVFNTFDGTLIASSVLAHEVGHAMHGYLAAETQPPIYYYEGHSSSVAETASNFHQAMVRAYLMKEKAEDRNFQLNLIDEAMFNFHRYFFIMPTLARFEYEVFSRAENDEPLNAEILKEIAGGFFAEGYGDTMTDDPARTAITWAQFGHLYTPYYTFQYSIGISAAHALAEGVLAGRDGAAEKYLEMLKSGGSLYPMDLFKLAGVDMTSPDPVVKTFSVLERIVARLESLVS